MTIPEPPVPETGVAFDPPGSALEPPPPPVLEVPD